MAEANFNSLLAAGEDDQTHRFEINGQNVEIKQTCTRISAGRSELELAFKLAAPQRFDVGVLVPAGCRNACATLNSQLLISWFSEDVPAEFPEIKLSNCQQQGSPISTLHPGQVQKLNFRWQDGDLLKFYWIW